MKTIQRIYLYAVSLISMEVVLWGMIGLARSIFSDSSSGGVSQLSQALALILVGVPVFGIHWWAAQRSANQDEEERSSGVRALFLYAVLLGLLIPYLLLISSLALTLMMLVAILVRIRIKDELLKIIPALFYMMINGIIFYLVIMNDFL